MVDLGLLMGAAAGRDRLDTRIILIDVGIHGGIELGYLGLVAEGVDEVRAVDESRRAAAGLVGIGGAPYLGEVYETDEGLLQMIDPGLVPVGMLALPAAPVARESESENEYEAVTP